MHDDLGQLRRRQDALAAAADARAPAAGPGAACVVAVTTHVTAYPTSGPVMVAVQRVTVAVKEREGAIPAFAPVGPVFYALCGAASIPPEGTHVLLAQAQGLWGFA